MKTIVRTNVVVLLLAAGAQTPSPGQAVARLEANPATITLAVGDSVPLVVTAYDPTGRVMDTPIRFAAPRRNLRVRDGHVHGIVVGAYQIVATVMLPPGGSDTIAPLEIPVTVRWPAVTQVTIDAEPGRLYRGTTLRHWVRAVHRDGSQRPNPEVVWATSDSTIARVDRFGFVTALGTGTVTLSASVEAATARKTFTVAPLSVAEIELVGGMDEVQTGDVQRFTVVARDSAGHVIDDAPVTWSHSYVPAEGLSAPAAPGQLYNGKFVADVPGAYTVVASVGPVRAAKSFRVVPRTIVQQLDVVGQGRQQHVRTTDFWVFEGRDGRDYALSGAKQADGHAYAWDVTDPSNIFKTDSIQVDARSVNDVKVSPDARYATMTREGASNSRNGVVILDLADPAHPTIASMYDEGLTGGVHNAFPTNDYVFALSDGDKYVILDVRDIYAPRYVSEYNHPNSRVHDVWVHNGIAYSAEWGSGVVVVDVGNGRWGGTIEQPVFVTSYPLPTGATHAVFPYVQESSGKFYLFAGDEIMNRRGLAMEGSRGLYRQPYDPATGEGGVPVSTQGYIQVIDFTDAERPEMVARYEVSEYGTHNIWVENDVLYQAYYEGGVRVVDVSGELMGNLYTQGREIAVYKPYDPIGFIPNAPMVWSAMPHKGHVFFSDTNSGLWSVKLTPRERPVM